VKKRLTLAEARALRQSLRQELSYQLPTWRLLAQFCAPDRLKENAHDRTYGARKGRAIVNNTQGRCRRTFTSGMINGAVPRDRNWFMYTLTNKTKLTGRVDKALTLRRDEISEFIQMSNFYRIMPMAFNDVAAFSNAAFAQLPHPRYGFYFYPFQVGTYAFSCDSEGKTNMFVRDFSLTVRQYVEQYCSLKPNGQIDFARAPSWVIERWNAAAYMDKVILTQLIVPNPYFNSKVLSLDPLDKKFQCYTFVESFGGGLPPQTSTGFRSEQTMGKEPDFCKVSGYDYFPVITPRWEVMAEESYGIGGPAHVALDDVMTLQEMERYRLEAVAKLVKPPMVGPASLRRHHSSILAGGITYVDDEAMKHGFKPAFELDPKLSELIASKEEYQEAIKDSFYYNLFLMLAGSETKTHVTAREIEEKAGERMSVLASVLGQLDQDLNSPVLYNAQLILEQQKRLTPLPPEIRSEQMRPEYISVLHQATKIGLMNSAERTANFASSLSNALQDPALAQMIKGEETIRKYASYNGTDPSLIRDEQEMKQVRAQIAQRLKQQEQQAQMAAGAKVAKDLASAKMGEGNALDALSEAQG